MMLLNFDRIIIHFCGSILKYHYHVICGNTIGIFSLCSSVNFKINFFPKSSNQNNFKIKYMICKKIFSTSTARLCKKMVSRSQTEIQL
jgi:hypothetical protein